MNTLTRRISSAVLSAAMILHGPAAIAVAAPSSEDDQSTTPSVPDSEQAYQALYADVFGQLFGMPYDPSQWTYPLQGPVTGVGTVSGQNQYGQSFDLDVLVAAEVDLVTLSGLTAAQIAEIQSRQLTYTAVVGTLSGPFASLPVNGIVISSVVATVPDHRFVLSHLEDPNSALFSPPSLDSTEIEIPTAPEDDLDTTVDTTPKILAEYAHLLDEVEASDAHAAVLDPIFQQVFGFTPVSGSYALPFPATVSAPGYYQGSFEDGSDGPPVAYSLYAQSVTPFDIASASCVNADQAASLLAAGYEFHLVSGTLEGGQGSANISGLSVSVGEGTGSGLTILGEAQPGEGGGEVCGLGIWIPIPVPHSCTDAGCVAGCNAIYDAAVKAANAAYDLAIANAVAAYATALATAQNALDFTKATAIAALTAGLALCAKSQAGQLLACALLGVLAWWTGPALFLACLARVAAVYAACYAAAQLIYDGVVQAATATYNAAVGAAKATYQAAQAAAAAARDAAIEAARAARDACLAGCVTVCWKILWIYIPFF